jgi:hypothetical protein
VSIIGLLRTLEAITRPPRLGHDVDVEDGAAQLAEREAETECLVPEDFKAVCRCAACVAEERAAEDELAADDEEISTPRAVVDAGYALFDCTPLDRMLALCVECDYCGAVVADQCTIDGRPLPMTLPGCGGVHPSRIKKGRRESDDTPNPTEPGLTPDELADDDDDEPLPYFDPCPKCGATLRAWEVPASHVCTHTPIEPPLTPDELVGVRGILQERYGEACTCPSWGNPNWPHRHGCPADPHKSSASNRAGPGAESAPSPTIVQSAPPPTVDGEGPSEVSGIPPSHSEGLPDGDCFDYCVGHPDDATAEWIGEAVPVISEVLAEHMLRPDWGRTAAMCQCLFLFHDQQDWRVHHVAPLIANALAPHDK